jgi:hypothetical protein
LPVFKLRRRRQTDHSATTSSSLGDIILQHYKHSEQAPTNRLAKVWAKNEARECESVRKYERMNLHQMLKVVLGSCFELTFTSPIIDEVIPKFNFIFLAMSQFDWLITQRNEIMKATQN